MSSEVRGLRSIVEMSLHGTREDAERSSTVWATGEAVTAEWHVVQQSMMPQNEEAVELALMEEVEWRALETRRKMEEEEEFENCAEERGRRAMRELFLEADRRVGRKRGESESSIRSSPLGRHCSF